MLLVSAGGGDDFGKLRRSLAAWIAARVAPAFVDDLTQEVFSRLASRQSAAPSEIRSLGAYARRVALSVVADHHRRQGRVVELELRTEPASDPEPSAERGGFLATWLAAQIERLPPDLAHAVRECELRGRSHAAVARELGLPRSTVSSRVQRGRAELLRMLQECCDVDWEAGAVARCSPKSAGGC